MADRVLPGPVDSTACVREAVCIHTRKIFDSCKDKDCVEDLQVYPTVDTQAAVLAACSIRPRRAELLGVRLDVDEISFNRGFYTVDVRYFYKIRGEAYPSSQEVEGLAVFDKRVILFGSEGCAKSFSSDDPTACGTGSANGLPIAVIDAVDPIALRMSIADEVLPPAEIPCDIPSCVSEQFDSPIAMNGNTRQWLVTLGQFSIIRLERDVQLLMPSYDYCMPEKECPGSSEDDPCTLFGRIRFPLEEFYPPDDCPCSDHECYRAVAEALN